MFRLKNLNAPTLFIMKNLDFFKKFLKINKYLKT